MLDEAALCTIILSITVPGRVIRTDFVHFGLIVWCYGRLFYTVVGIDTITKIEQEKRADS